MSAAPSQPNSPSADPAAPADASIPAAGSNQPEGGSSGVNAATAKFPSASAIKAECASASPEAMSAAIRAEISVLTAELARLDGLSVDMIAALVRERIAFLEAMLHSLRRWSSLYADALHSIFEFASLDDLSRLTRVSRRWCNAVLNVPRIGVWLTIVSEEHLAAVLASRLRHHVIEMYEQNQWRSELYSLSTSQLNDASVAMPGLIALKIQLSDADVESAVSALPRFPQLQSLSTAFSVEMKAANCNRVIHAVGELDPVIMHDLTIELPSQLQHISLAPLTALTKLRTFCFKFAGSERVLTDALINGLRALTTVRALQTPYTEAARTDFLTRMLQPGHKLRWPARMGCETILVTDPLAAVLGSVQKMTRLDASLRCLDVRFFAQLSELTGLTLNAHLPEMDLAAFVQSLAHCTRLTWLQLRDFSLRGEHLEVLLPALPRLSELSLHVLPQLESLRCFDSPTLAASLASLSVQWLDSCSPTELTHLFGLVSLGSLSIVGLQDPLTLEHKAQLRSHLRCRISY